VLTNLPEGISTQSAQVSHPPRQHPGAERDVGPCLHHDQTTRGACHR
jgi:hypothetical protein